ncbi:MAG: hypothetical protein J7M14_04110, partial [Planctomycetes bacterium]|nr:hypothetical protein [Planctomycetota bacterium]
MTLSEVIGKFADYNRKYGIRYTLSYAVSYLAGKTRRSIERNCPANPVKKARMRKLLKAHNRLHLGCGASRADGWVNVDMFPIKGVDFVCCLESLSKYVPRAAVAEVFVSHTLEHFSKASLRRLLADICAIMRDDGRLWISVPSLDRLYETARTCKSVDVMDKVVGILMGGGRDKSDYHRCAFTDTYLSELLKEAGFSRQSPWSDAPPELERI